VNLQIVSDVCVPVAKRLGLKPNTVKLASDKVEALDEKGENKLTEEEFLRSVLMLVYWAAPSVGGKLKPLSVSFTDFVQLMDAHIFSVDHENDMMAVVNAYEDSLANSFDISSLTLIGDKLTHFSAKLTHSKASGSVFIPTSRISDLPYFFSGSLQKTAPLPVDLAKNDGDAIAQSVAKLINGDTTSSVNKSVSTKTLMWHQSRPGHQLNTKSIDARLRQIIVPNESDGGYVSLSPLYAGGISRRINELNVERKLNGERIQIPFGGANSQNVSVHGQNLSNVWLFNTPSPDYDIKVAWAIALKGYWVRIDKAIAKDYSDWVQLNPIYGSDRDTLVAEEMERKQSPFHPMIHDVINDVETTMLRCEAAKESLEEKMVDLNIELTDLNPLERSLLSGSMTEAAIKDVTNRILKAMAKAEVFSNENTKSRHLRVIPEIIRKRLKVTLGGE